MRRNRLGSSDFTSRKKSIEVGSPSLELDHFLLILGSYEVPQRDSTAIRIPERSCDWTSSASAAPLLLQANRRSPAYRSASPRCSSTAKNDAAPRRSTFDASASSRATMLSGILLVVAPRHLSAKFSARPLHLLLRWNPRSPACRSTIPRSRVVQSCSAARQRHVAVESPGDHSLSPRSFDRDSEANKG